MKTFLKILAGFLVLLILIIAALNIYFTDTRLKNMILPQVSETLGTDVQVERMSLTFFRTFPQFGVEMDNFLLPDPQGNAVVSLDELIIGVRLFPLFRNELSVSRLSMNRPVLTYTVNVDSTTNIDFLLALMEEDEVEETDGYAISIPEFTIRDASVYYTDATTNTRITLENLDAEISLAFDELIESEVDLRIGSLSVMMDGNEYVSGLSLSLQQSSVIDTENEIVTITSGVFSIRGLALNLAGDIQEWSADEPLVNLQFNSSSDNFGELLRLAPAEYDEFFAGLETSGSLALEGSVAGRVGGETIPRFDIRLEVNDGYIKNPDLPQPIRDLAILMLADNDLVVIERFKAKSNENEITATGRIDHPFEDDGVFSVDMVGDVDLSTVSNFYPIGEFGLEQLAGILNMDVKANGSIADAENAQFNATLNLRDGLIKYKDVPRPIENITMQMDANQDLITIRSAGLQAAGNRLTMSGTVSEPLSDNPGLNLTSNLEFDLATVKDFYPIDEDTLMMRGNLKAEVVLQGRANEIEQALNRSTIELRNGYLNHSSLGKPMEDITFIATASNTRLNITESNFKSGNNALAMRGNIDQYMSDDPMFNLTLDGAATLSDVSAYYTLAPWIEELMGEAVMNLNATGRAGDPTAVALNGALDLRNVSAIGDSLPLPVTNLRGKLQVTPDAMNLNDFYMDYGSSDIALEGRMQNYLGFLKEHSSTATMPTITGSYKSLFLNMDEMIDWEDETDDVPIPIELPNITSTVTASIDTLLFFGVAITNIEGKGRTTPTQILMDEARATMFEGTATGRMQWDVPQPDRTKMYFNGELSDLTAESFFREYALLGKNSRFHEHVRGAFSGTIRYVTELDQFLSPDITTTDAAGTFGMTRARLQGHPVQVKIAEFLRTPALGSAALDEWNASFTIKESVMTLSDFQLSSDGIGVELNGTQHMVTDVIRYDVNLRLPPSFKNTIASVITSQAADALTQEDGTIIVPLRITGTSASPTVGVNRDIVDEIVRDYLRGRAGDAVRRIFGGGN